MTAGQIWQRPDGECWVETQTAAVDPSGWRLMIPLVGPGDAADAPPLVVTVGGWRARVHLLTSAASHELGQPAGHLTDAQLADLQAAVRAMVAE